MGMSVVKFSTRVFARLSRVAKDQQQKKDQSRLIHPVAGILSSAVIYGPPKIP
jgi:hypothetical protein